MSSPLGPFSRDESAVVTAFKGGDVAAFQEVYHAFFPRLCDYAATITPDGDARDVVQNVFWAVWNGRERLTPETVADLYRYLLRAVRNGMLREVRHAARWVAMDDEPANGSVRLATDDCQGNGDHETPDALDALETRVRHAIDMLPPRSREMLQLRWYHGIALDDIAEVMGITYAYARVLHVRAMTALRAQLGPLAAGDS